MKKLTSLLIFILLTISTTNLLSQKVWEKYQENPILELGPSGSWDDTSISGCSVIFDGELYHMWYSGYNGTNHRIGYASSPDGLNWEKNVNNPVLDLGASESWDDYFVYYPCVIFNGSTYHMWYAGNNEENERIGHATSTDGIGWIKDPENPVLDIGLPGSWEDTQVFPVAGSVIFDGEIYHMWYGGGNSDFRWAIGHATSTDGTTWIKDETNNPVMKASSQGSWDWNSVIPGTVLFNGNSYEAWYSGCAIISRWRVGYATSADGITWIKDTVNPVLDFGSSGSWDSEQVWLPSVIFDSVEQIYKMWYAGGPHSEEHIGYATAILDPDGFGEDLFSGPTQRIILMKTYPNPFYTSATIEYELKKPESVSLTIYDMAGHLIYQTQKYQMKGNRQLIWNAIEYPMGIYYFKIQVDSQFVYGKMVKAM